MINEENKIKIRKIDFVYIGLIIGLLWILFSIYKTYCFNDYIKSEYIRGVSSFYRDRKNKMNNITSYCIKNNDYNDAMFSKKVEVKPNTNYRVTCFVKTKNVQTKKEDSLGGAHIAIASSTERSAAITGTNDEWTLLEFMFDSKNRTEVEIGFRLGGYDSTCIGEAWFVELKMEVGVKDESADWKFGCFLMNEIKVEAGYENLTKDFNILMSQEDKADMMLCMERFKETCNTLSDNKINVSYDIINILEPITSVTYDSINGYYISPKDVKKQIQQYIELEEYDHIFVVVRMGEINGENEIPVNDWIGLGGMDYYGIGFSNIRLPNSEVNYIYKYDSRINTFPEEVFLHEFLHTLERNAEENGYEIPALHDYKIYNYKNEKIEGLKQWYQDYMQKTIEGENGYVGLPEKIYNIKIPKNSDFAYAYTVDEFKEPKNIIEDVRLIGKKIFDLLEYLKHKKID